MEDLFAWLRSVLTEDERCAWESIRIVASQLPGADAVVASSWRVADRAATGTFVTAHDQWDRAVEVVPTYGGAHADHIARHDPQTVLAEIKAKRELLEAAERAFRARPGPGLDPSRAAWETAVRLLAGAYRHRPGWKQEWRA